MRGIEQQWTSMIMPRPGQSSDRFRSTPHRTSVTLLAGVAVLVASAVARATPPAAERGGSARPVSKAGDTHRRTKELDDGAGLEGNGLTQTEQLDADLCSAAMGGDVEAARLALDAGANASTVGWLKLTPLDCAARRNDTAMAKLLADRGADLNNNVGEAGAESTLHVAASHGAADVAALLVKRGADLEARGYDGETPLHKSAREGQLSVMKVLIEARAAINARDATGQTPLHYAGTLEAAALLLDHGADLEAKDQDGRTPLHEHATIMQDRVCRLLVRRGANLDARDRAGLTPMDLARREGDEETVRLLRIARRSAPRTKR
jgi:ankyrin repeat protein